MLKDYPKLQIVNEDMSLYEGMCGFSLVRKTKLNGIYHGLICHTSLNKNMYYPYCIDCMATACEDFQGVVNAD